MKKTLICLLALAIYSVSPAFAAPISQDDRAAITESLDLIAHAIEKHDVTLVADRSFDLLINQVGGRDAYIKVVDASFKSLETQHYKLISYQSEIPHDSVDAGAYEVCAVKETLTFEVDGGTVRGISYSLAIRKKTGHVWQFISGAGISKHPEFLKKILPDLPASFQLPKLTATELSGKDATDAGNKDGKVDAGNTANTDKVATPQIPAEKLVEIINRGKTYPVVINDETSMLAMRGEKNTLYYKFSIATPLNSAEERAIFATVLQKSLTKQSCTSENFSNLLTKGYNLDFTYVTSANIELTHVRMEAGSCKK